MTPATQPAVFAPIFAMGFGTPDLVTNAYRETYLEDTMAHPDGGFPTVTTGVPTTAPGTTLRSALVTNDLRNWVPAAPVLLCGGDEDPTVFFFNTLLMQSYWTANPPTGAATVSYLDVDSAATASDPYATLKSEFQTAKNAVVALNGTTAMLQSYHASLVPPVCLSAVKSFFDGLQ